jgi:hypothetical protein
MNNTFNWQDCQRYFASKIREQLASERGLEISTFERVATWKGIGVINAYNPTARARDWCLAFPVRDETGAIVRAHCRWPARNAKGKWDWFYYPYDPEQKPIPALVYGLVRSSQQVFLLESQWDAVALIEILDLFDQIERGEVAIVSTRGVSISNRLSGLPWREDVTLYAVPQNDGPGQKWLREAVGELSREIYVLAIPQSYKDLNPWIKEGHARAADIEPLLENAPPVTPKPDQEHDPPGEGELGPNPAFDQGPRSGFPNSSQAGAQEVEQPTPIYKPRGNSPLGYLEQGICQDDILLADGFLERGSAALLAGPSGIGKSSIAMQVGCCWSCGKPAFDLSPPRALRIVMVQNEDSRNDLVRMSEALRHLQLDPELIRTNFWIETLRGKIGPEAVGIMRQLVHWHQADLLLINPISAYHDGDISQNKDNIRFLYRELGALLDEERIGIFAFHHKGKPKSQSRNNQAQAQSVYYEVMYDILGGSALTNFFRGIITVSPIGNSDVFRFTLAKRFEQSGWPLKTQQFKWHQDRQKRLWIPASVAEEQAAHKNTGKTLEDLHRLLPPTDPIHRDQFWLLAKKNRFTRDEYRGLLAEAQRDDTPDSTRIYTWRIYTGRSPQIHYARHPQHS